jgi:hypothetical protein
MKLVHFDKSTFSGVAKQWQHLKSLNIQLEKVSLEIKH